MIRRLIEFSARHRALVLLLNLAAVAYGIWSLRRVKLDAIPDLSDTQVIVYSRWDRSPDLVEDQVTYPIVTSLLGAPKVKAVRGFSDFGYSYVYAIFEDGTDLYWARSRVLEYLAKITPTLPEGVRTELGPDATGVGWVYQYALVDRSGRRSLDELRALQDWNLRYAIQSVPGVAEVASLGGFVRQFQVTADPWKLSQHGLSYMDVARAIREGNSEVGGRLIEYHGAEYMVRGRAYLKSEDDLRRIALKSAAATPVRLGDVADVALGPDIRRGVADLDGLGDTATGIVVMRHGENALAVIERVKARLDELKSSLPAGVEIVPAYDRSDLIHGAVKTLRRALIEEIVIVSLVILLFLWHFPSAIVPILTIPVSVLLAFIPMERFGVSANLMSLAGIALSIGVLVDGAIVEVENAYNKIERWIADGRKGDFHEVRLEALKEVGPGVFFSLLVIAAAFLPIFALVDQEGRLFRPLALTKNLTMAIAALLAVTLDPALRMLFTRLDPFKFRPRWLAKAFTGLFVGRYVPEERHPISRRVFAVYEPVCAFALRHPKKLIAGAILITLTTLPVYFKLGAEFMPPLDEGALLYMPTTPPGLSVSEAQRLINLQDRLIADVPEVASVLGKAGRAETATDPAPFAMAETVIVLKPRDAWRARPRWYSSWLPEFMQRPLRHLWPDRITTAELIAELDEKTRLPGVANAWTMPIKNRIDMLSTGIRTPVGIKIFGADLAEIERAAVAVEAAVRGVEGARSVFAERVAGGYYLDIVPDREAIARYGLSAGALNETVMQAVGGENVTTLYAGRERFPVNLRMPRELREDPEALARLPVMTPAGAFVPLGQLAKIGKKSGPAMIRDENGRLTGYVYVDVAGRDVGSFVEAARARVAQVVTLPPGYYLQWSGQWENMLRVRERLKTVVPVTLLLIFLLLMLNTGSAGEALLVMLAVPFSAIGAVWLLWLLGYHASIASWVGMIALMGLDAETGVFMLMFLDLAFKSAVAAGGMKSEADLRAAIMHGAVKRARPKLMTVCAALLGLIPILWSQGPGADMMKRVVAPMVGGLVTSFLLELLVYPAIYFLMKRRALPA